eukprot:GDKJ01032940.1.p1 GENE.GDKJ01032940.1~~GDKJ01032940.1.p1  ORF type:complete len:267 (-),score=48.58 GDKJ01032940.1:134-934(-)
MSVISNERLTQIFERINTPFVCQDMLSNMSSLFQTDSDSLNLCEEVDIPKYDREIQALQQKLLWRAGEMALESCRDGDAFFQTARIQQNKIVLQNEDWGRCKDDFDVRSFIVTKFFGGFVEKKTYKKLSLGSVKDCKKFWVENGQKLFLKDPEHSALVDICMTSVRFDGKNKTANENMIRSLEILQESSKTFVRKNANSSDDYSKKNNRISETINEIRNIASSCPGSYPDKPFRIADNEGFTDPVSFTLAISETALSHIVSKCQKK